MATNEIKTRIRSAYKTESEWESSNPILLLGEKAYTKDGDNDGYYKIGDGTSSWSQLSYVLPSKSDIGLGNVENKSSATIRGELTKENVTTALGYTPSTEEHTHSSYANQNAFSNIVVGSTTVSADTTTDSLTLVAGSNVTISADATNDKITISATDTNTHYASGTIVNNSTTATINASTALTNGNVYLNHIENGAVKNSHKISGAGATTVTSDTSGNIIISSTDTDTTYSAAGASLGLVKTGNGFTLTDGIISVSEKITATDINGLDW